MFIVGCGWVETNRYRSASRVKSSRQGALVESRAKQEAEMGHPKQVSFPRRQESTVLNQFVTATRPCPGHFENEQQAERSLVQ